MKYTKSQLESIVLGQLETLFLHDEKIDLLQKQNLLLEKRNKQLEDLIQPRRSYYKRK